MPGFRLDSLSFDLHANTILLTSCCQQHNVDVGLWLQADIQSPEIEVRFALATERPLRRQSPDERDKFNAVLARYLEGLD